MNVVVIRGLEGGKPMEPAPIVVTENDGNVEGELQTQENRKGNEQGTCDRRAHLRLVVMNSK